VDLLQSDLRAPLTPGQGPQTRGRPSEASGSDAAVRRGLVGFLVVVSAARLAYLAVGDLDLSPDEAHYWEWSRRLDLSYYSKGPLIAYLIAALTATLGTSVLAIRSGAVLLSLLGAVAIARLGREAFSDLRVGALAVVGLQLTPLVWAGSLLLTIDAPFVVCWAFALLWLHRALVRGLPAAWPLAGLAVGIGLLAKYTMLFVLPGLLVYLWRAPAARPALLRREAALGGVIALTLFSPVVIWNLGHGWVSARHVASQGQGAGPGVATLAEFLLSQAGVLTPLWAVLIGWGLWHGIREGLVRGREPYRFLTSFGGPVLVFYTLLAFQGKVQANWAVAAYPPLVLVTVGALLARRADLPAGRRVAQTRLLLAAGGVALAVTVAGHATVLLGVPDRLDPTARLRGWRELGAAVSSTLAAMPRPAQTFVVSDRYQITSELAFYVDGRPPAYNVNLGRRLNQYDFWEGAEARLGWDAIYVRQHEGPLDARVTAAFERMDGPSVVEIRRGGRRVRTFSVYRGFGFRGFPRPVGPATY
jgi:4-amino-4-deoxy-L-arabinose transferase-like glycosyltransferase